MLVAEKTHHINSFVYGQGADFLISILKKQLPELEVIPQESEEESPDDEEYVEVADSDWYKGISARMTPGDYLVVRRENRGWTQKELSERTGIAVPNISLMEAGKRPIGARTARKLAEALGCDVSNFIS